MEAKNNNIQDIEQPEGTTAVHTSKPLQVPEHSQPTSNNLDITQNQLNARYPSEIEHSIFVGGLQPQVTQQDLESYFDRYGIVNRVMMKLKGNG